MKSLLLATALALALPVGTAAAEAAIAHNTTSSMGAPLGISRGLRRHDSAQLAAGFGSWAGAAEAPVGPHLPQARSVAQAAGPVHWCYCG